MLRFVAEREEAVFQTIDELRMEPTSRFHKVGNARPVWERVEGELTKQWTREAHMGRSLEELARYWESYLMKRSPCNIICLEKLKYCLLRFWCSIFLLQGSWPSRDGRTGGY